MTSNTIDIYYAKYTQISTRKIHYIKTVNILLRLLDCIFSYKNLNQLSIIFINNIRSQHENTFTTTLLAIHLKSEIEEVGSRTQLHGELLQYYVLYKVSKSNYYEQKTANK